MDTLLIWLRTYTVQYKNVTREDLDSLRDLDLSNNRLSYLPPEIGKLTSLCDLYLDNNQLTSVPPEICALTSLRKLFLSNNQLTSVPPEIGALTSLEWLTLENNQITSMPPEICMLTSLRSVNLRKNRLTVLPPEIGALTSLRRLRLGINQLTVLPSEIRTLTSLQWLELSNNQLTTLPPEICNHLTSLQCLHLQNNNLTSLPESLIHFNFRYIWLKENYLPDFRDQKTCLPSPFENSSQPQCLDYEIRFGDMCIGSFNKTLLARNWPLVDKIALFQEGQDAYLDLEAFQPLTESAARTLVELFSGQTIDLTQLDAQSLVDASHGLHLPQEADLLIQIARSRVQ